MSSNYCLVVDEIKRLRDESELIQAQYESKLIFSDVIVHMNKKFSTGNHKPSEIVENDSYFTQAYNYLTSFF
jgi:hypothetical protein